MLIRRIAYLAVIVATVAVTSGSASADDTVRGYGVEITTPEGWKTATGPRELITLLPSDTGHFLELYRFTAVPQADKAGVASLFAKRKDTTDVAVTQASATTTGAIAARGTMKIKGTAVAFTLISLPVEKHAVTIVSYIESTRVKAIEPIHEKIIASMKSDTRKARKSLPKDF